MKKKEQSVSIEHWCHTKPRRFYDGLKLRVISVEPFEGLLAASMVIEQNDIIKATSQDLAPDVNFQDDGFEVTWE